MLVRRRKARQPMPARPRQHRRLPWSGAGLHGDALAAWPRGQLQHVVLPRVRLGVKVVARELDHVELPLGDLGARCALALGAHAVVMGDGPQRGQYASCKSDPRIGPQVQGTGGMWMKLNSARPICTMRYWPGSFSSTFSTKAASIRSMRSGVKWRPLPASTRWTLNFLLPGANSFSFTVWISTSSLFLVAAHQALERDAAGVLQLVFLAEVLFAEPDQHRRVAGGRHRELRTFETRVPHLPARLHHFHVVAFQGVDRAVEARGHLSAREADRRELLQLRFVNLDRRPAHRRRLLLRL